MPVLDRYISAHHSESGGPLFESHTKPSEKKSACAVGQRTLSKGYFGK